MAFSIWGVLPLYWKALSAYPAELVLSYRVFFSLITTALLFVLLRRKSHLGPKPFRALLFMALQGCTIGVNWWIYIWGVQNGRVLESSFGYYLSPIASVFLGAWILHESLNRFAKLSIALALTGILVKASELERFPWVGLSLCISFAFYALLRRLSKQNPLDSLLWETIFMQPVAFFFFFKDGFGIPVDANMTHASIFSFWIQSIPNVSQFAMISLSGIITLVPLWCFAKAAQGMTMGSLGFVQYLSPTLQFMLGFWVFKESTHPRMWVAFGFTWLAVILFMVSRFKNEAPKVILPAPK